MKILNTLIPGCYELQPQLRSDSRGTFVKTFHQEVFAASNLEIHYAEEYYSISHQGVLRGLHFQTPPWDHVKLVYCVAGAVMDAVVDLRKNSPTFGKFCTFELSGEAANMVYIPKGLAHGFYVRQAPAIMMYKVTTVYAPTSDGGILWNSAGIPWPNGEPIISDRDRAFIPLAEFDSPFIFPDSKCK